MGRYECAREVEFSHPSVTAEGVCDHQGVTISQQCVCVCVSVSYTHSRSISLINSFNLPFLHLHNFNQFGFETDWKLHLSHIVDHLLCVQHTAES